MTIGVSVPNPEDVVLAPLESRERCLLKFIHDCRLPGRGDVIFRSEAKNATRVAEFEWEGIYEVTSFCWITPQDYRRWLALLAVFGITEKIVERHTRNQIIDGA